MAMRILPAFLMSSSASALATWLAPIIAATATKAIMIFFIVSSSLDFSVSLLASCIHVGELGHAPAELLFGREFGVEIGRDQVLGEPRPDDLRADAHHVDVVMFHTLMRGVDVVAHRRANALHLVGADRGADAGAAH